MNGGGAAGADPLAVPVEGGLLRGGIWNSTSRTGAVVVAAHGITSNHLAWAKVARLLAGSAQEPPIAVAAPDLRGRVLSAALPGPWGMRRHAADLVALLDHLGVERTVLAGHSMGAWVAAMVAATAPERVSGLVLVDGGVSLPPSLPEGASPDAVLDAVLGPAIARLRRTYPTRDSYLAEWQAHPAFREGLDRETRSCLLADLAGSGFSWRSSVREEAVRADGRELVVDGKVLTSLLDSSQPAVIVRAARGLLDDSNVMVPTGALEQAQARRSNLEVADVPGSNHYSVLLGDRGAAAVAGAIRQVVALTGT